MSHPSEPIPDLHTSTAITASSIMRRSQAYEFNPEDNHLIAKLTFRMFVVGVGVLVLGVVSLLVGIVRFRSGPEMAVLGLILFVVGYYTIQSANSFRRIVEESGSDVPHLRNALANLAMTYGIFMALMVLFTAFVIILTCFGVLVQVTGMGAPPPA